MLTLLINLTSTISSTRSIDDIQDISTCVTSIDSIRKVIENSINNVFFLGNNTLDNTSTTNIANEIIVFILSLCIMLIGILIWSILYPYRKDKKLIINRTTACPSNDREHIVSSNNINSNHQYNISKPPMNVPKHIAVIMDGNRRFGREIHSDPLQVVITTTSLV